MSRQSLSFQASVPAESEPTGIAYEHTDSEGRVFVWTYSEVGRADIAAGLARYLHPQLRSAFTGFQVPTVRQYYHAWRAICRKLNEREAPEGSTFSAIQASDIAALDDPRTYGLLGCVVRSLRLVDHEYPDVLPGDVKRRLSYVTACRKPHAKPRQAFEPAEAALLREAADRAVREVSRRISAGRQRREELLAKPARTRVEDLSLRVMDGERGCRNEDARRLDSVRQVAESTTLGLYDAVAFTVAIGLRVEIPLECIKQLSRDCLQNAARGFVDIVYVKHRGGRHTRIRTERVRDGGLTTPGGLIRLALQLTDEAATRLAQAGARDATKLWVGWVERGLPSWRAFSLCPTAISRGVASLNVQNEKGERITSFSGARMRKTVKVTNYRLKAGHLRRFASDNSIRVADKHYARVEALEEDHKTAVELGIKSLLTTALDPIVLNENDEANSRQDGLSFDDQPSRTGEQMQDILDGHHDTWLGICIDFWASPVSRSSDGACTDGLARCLHCPNAVFTARRLPALLSYGAWIKDRRAVMGEATWLGTYGADLMRIEQQIVPRFAEETVREARAAAKQVVAVDAVPPHQRRS